MSKGLLSTGDNSCPVQKGWTFRVSRGFWQASYEKQYGPSQTPESKWTHTRRSASQVSVKTSAFSPGSMRTTQETSDTSEEDSSTVVEAQVSHTGHSTLAFGFFPNPQPQNFQVKGAIRARTIRTPKTLPNHVQNLLILFLLMEYFLNISAIPFGMHSISNNIFINILET